MGLKDSIQEYFSKHPRAKKALGVATAIASNFAMIIPGNTILAATAGAIVDHKQNQDKMDPDKLMDFFRKAIQEPDVQDSIKNAVKEGGVDVTHHVSTAMNQLGVRSPDTGQFVSSMKSEITVIARELGIIRELISYYEIPDTKDRVMNVWRLPTYLDDVMVIDDERKAVVDSAIRYVREESNVVILGGPGSGKTTIMYAIWKELDRDTDTALVWDTKDISKVHERHGVVLFCDDLPETRELTKAIVEKDVRGIVTTAREQEWSRLPANVRACFKAITLPNLSDTAMAEIVSKHLGSQNVEYDDDALEAIIENAQGSPIYVRYIAEEIGADYRNGKLTKLIKTRAMRAPKGMTDYVAGILARILFNLEGTIYTPKAGALPVIKTLLCLADMPNYETHEVHLNQVFFACKQPSDSPGPFNAIKQYLSRDPRFFSLKFMHDTLADVLRGSVDHPIVGDIRLIAQELGVAGRRKLEEQALGEGWEHVKAEYDIDEAGNLEPLLAYAYFAAKNFGVEYTDRNVIDLANVHVENPISQGLFAVLGPISEIKEKQDKIKIAEAPDAITSMKEKPAVKDTKIRDISQLIREKIGGAVTEEEAARIEKEIANIPDLSDFSELVTKMPGDIGPTVSKFIEEQLGSMSTETMNSFDQLEAGLEQESISPARLARLLRKASTRAAVRGSRKKIKDTERIGDLLHRGAQRLVLLDSMLYIENLDGLSEGLSAIKSETDTARIITDTTREIAVSLLDDKNQKIILDVFSKGANRSAKMSDYDGMFSYYFGKWEFFGTDPKDLSKISNHIANLMKLGRTPYAYKVLNKCLALFDDNKIENHIGMTLQAFKDLSRAQITEREEFSSVVKESRALLKVQIEKLRKSDLLVGNSIAADLCTEVTKSVISSMDNYVKKAGKAIAAESVYPLLHVSVKQLILDCVKILKEIGIEKSNKALTSIVSKMPGESKHKNNAFVAAKSLSG